MLVLFFYIDLDLRYELFLLPLMESIAIILQFHLHMFTKFY